MSSQFIIFVWHINIWWHLIARPRFREHINKLMRNCIPHLLKVCNLLILSGHLIHVLKPRITWWRLFLNWAITLPSTRITSLTLGQRFSCIIEKRYFGESLFLMRDSGNIIETISLTRARRSLPWVWNMSNSFANFWPGIISWPPEWLLLLTLCRRKLIVVGVLFVLFTVSRLVEHFFCLVVRVNWKSFLNLAKINVIFTKLLKLKK